MKNVLQKIIAIVLLGAIFPVITFAYNFAPNAGLVSYWSFKASNSNDEVASNNGADTGITYSAGNGILNIGAGINNGNSVISVPRNVNMEASKFTFGGWVKIGNDNTNAIMFSKNYTNTNSSPFLSYELRANSAASTSLRYDSNASGVYYNFSITVPTMVKDSWHHIMATYDGTNVVVYFDGVAKATSARTAPTFSGLGKYEMANDVARTGGGSFVFAIDEAGYWNRALSSGEINTLYNYGIGLSPIFSPTVFELPKGRFVMPTGSFNI